METFCPSCCDKPGQFIRGRYLFRADVRTMDDHQIVQDKSIPVLFCPTCGRKLPEVNQSVPEFDSTCRPKGFAVKAYEVYEQFPERLGSGSTQRQLMVTQNFQEALAFLKNNSNATDLCRYLKDPISGKLITQHYNPYTKLWED